MAYGYGAGGSGSLYQATAGSPSPIYTGPYYGQMRQQLQQSQRQLGDLYGQQSDLQRQMNDLYGQDPGLTYLRQLLQLNQPVHQRSVANQYYGY